MFNSCGGGCCDILWLLLLCGCCGGDNCGCKKVDCQDLIFLYILMNCCCGKDKCCC